MDHQISVVFKMITNVFSNKKVFLWNHFDYNCKLVLKKRQNWGLWLLNNFRYWAVLNDYKNRFNKLLENDQI